MFVDDLERSKENPTEDEGVCLGKSDEAPNEKVEAEDFDESVEPPKENPVEGGCVELFALLVSELDENENPPLGAALELSEPPKENPVEEVAGLEASDVAPNEKPPVAAGAVAALDWSADPKENEGAAEGVEVEPKENPPEGAEVEELAELRLKEKPDMREEDYKEEIRRRDDEEWRKI